MHAFEIALGVAAVLTWTYLLFGRGQFWRIRKLPPHSFANSASKRVVAIIPARNEAELISESVSSLMRVPFVVQVIVVNDNSTDDTAKMALQTAHRTGTAGRLTIVTGSALPSGWSGKLWAVHQGLEQASEFAPDFLLLTDADIVHAPGDLERLVRIAETTPCDLASLIVRLHCKTVAEKLLIPAFVYFFFKLYPPDFINDARRKTAGAAGGCMLIRPEALQRAGGLDAIRGEIIDDCALARLIKQSGGKIWLGAAEQAESVRRYDSFAEIGRMISRTAFNQLRHSSLLLAGTIVGLLLTYIAPVGLLFSSDRVANVLGLISLMLMLVTYFPVTRYYGRNFFWALTLPFAALFYMGATVVSALNFWLGRGGQWKGRAQDLVHTPE